jgi:glycosyltransferase involved in cell wall biosynthesis
MRKVTNLLGPAYDCTPSGEPSITVIVPARNEARDIARTLNSLLQQDYPNLHIIVVNDRSTDTTGAIIDSFAAQHAAKLSSIHVRELPSGWLGKPHALALAARPVTSDYLLFTDADIWFRPDAVRRALAQAVATNADHFVTVPTPLIHSTGEGALLGCMNVMALWAARPWKADDPKAKHDAIGIGAFNLMKTSAYRNVGGFEALRSVILEDLTLARRVKHAGLRQRVAIAPGMITLHWASGAGGIIDVTTKNLFAAVAFRVSFLFLAVLGCVLMCLAPFAFVLLSATRLAAIVTLAAIFGMYKLAGKMAGIAAIYAAFFPVGILLFLFALLRSAATTLHHGGVVWRGTFYPLQILRQSVPALHQEDSEDL